jgi:tetratricopeptide (TPR) repeat protein
MRTAFRAAVLAALLAGVAVPAPARAEPEVPSSATPSTDPQGDADRAAYDAAVEKLTSRDFAGALKSIRSIKADPSNVPGTALISAVEAGALFGLKRDGEARRMLDRSMTLGADNAEIGRVIFYIGLMTGSDDMSGQALDRLIAKAPDIARDLDHTMVMMYVRDHPAAKSVANADRVVKLAQISFGGTPHGQYLARDAIRVLLARSDVARAGALVSHIVEPSLLGTMLVTRRYAALWPVLEKHAGPGMASAREILVREARAAYEAKPDDSERLAAMIEALRQSGRLREAIAMRDRLPDTAAAMTGADEDMGWAVNAVAYALHEAGRKDEADALFASLNDRRVDDGWRISMIINRIEMLVSDGNYARALPLIAPAQALNKSPYAEQLLRRLKYCALSGLGRKADAAGLLKDMMTHADAAYRPTISALLCAGEVDRAEALALKALQSDDFTDDFVVALQPVAWGNDDPSVWSKRWDELRQRPAIAAAYARLGRDLPTSLVPPPSIR